MCVRVVQPNETFGHSCACKYISCDRIQQNRCNRFVSVFRIFSLTWITHSNHSSQKRWHQYSIDILLIPKDKYTHTQHIHFRYRYNRNRYGILLIKRYYEEKKKKKKKSTTKYWKKTMDHSLDILKLLDLFCCLVKTYDCDWKWEIIHSKISNVEKPFRKTKQRLWCSTIRHNSIASSKIIISSTFTWIFSISISVHTKVYI